jgi:hypothetical protein
VSQGENDNQVSRFTQRTAVSAVSYQILDALLLLFILTISLQTPREPDFGWHLHAGLDLIAHGWQMPMTDPMRIRCTTGPPRKGVCL